MAVSSPEGNPANKYEKAFIRERKARLRAEELLENRSRELFLEREKVEHKNEQLNKTLDELRETLSELQQAQVQLVQSEKMASLGQLAAGVAHEINNPVGFVGSNLITLEKYKEGFFKLMEIYEELEEKVEGYEETCEKIAEIKREIDWEFFKEDADDLFEESRDGVKRVKEIVMNLKSFSHVDTEEWQWGDLHKGIDSTLNVVHHELKYKADIKKNYGDVPQVYCVQSQINQVTMNMLVNSVHAMEEKGEITISTGVENEQVWIEISDTGKGMEESTIQHIFDPFYTTKPVGEGTGLGLSLSYGIIERHGGEIKVNSKVGEGTTFKIILPVNSKGTE